VKSQRWWLSLGITVIAAAGCMVAPGTAVETSPEVSVMTVGAPLRDPVYSYRDDALVGITDDGRVAEVSNLLRSNATTRFSPPMPVGRNLQISRKDEGHVFVPQPQRGKVAVLDLTSLRQVDEFDAGPAPAYLSEDAGMRVLLALSAAGSSVTPIDEYGFRKLPTAKIPGDPSNMIDGANRGRDIEYHVYGPSGIRFYRGPTSPPEELGSMDMPVAAAAGDGAAVTRSYVARPNSDLLYCVDLRRAGKGLKVRAATQLPSPIRRLGTDDARIYAATDRELVALETVTFMRFEADIIPVLRTTNYRAAGT
jgi:hypothetical protein